MDNWQRFEHLAQVIQQELAPEAVVTRNERLRGRSSVIHQCDVVVRSKVGQYEFTCVIECKDLAEKVGLEIVRGVVARVEDLSVSQGVIVSSRGFTDDALTFATAKGLLTYTLVDAETIKWAELAMLPALGIFIWLQTAMVQFTRSDGTKVVFPSVEAYESVSLVECSTGHRLPLATYLARQWDAVCCSPIIEEPRDYVDSSGEYALIEDSRTTAVEIAYQLVPGFTYCYGHVPLKVGRGFVDAKSGAVLIGGNYETGIVRIRDMHFNWPRVERREDVPFQPVIQFHTPVLFSQPDQALEAVSIARQVHPMGRPTTLTS
jgi:hypothetical protein